MATSYARTWRPNSSYYVLLSSPFEKSWRDLVLAGTMFTSEIAGSIGFLQLPSSTLAGRYRDGSSEVVGASIRVGERASISPVPLPVLVTPRSGPSVYREGLAITSLPSNPIPGNPWSPGALV